MPTYSDVKIAYEKISRLDEQIQAMKTYQNELDEVFSLQSKEMDSLIKMTANNNYIKIREIETKVETTTNEITSTQNIINIQLAEISKDIEMVKKNRSKIESLEWAQDDKAKLEILVAENEQLWTFVQGFVDEQSITYNKKMQNNDLKLSDKMHALDWVARNAIYCTPNSVETSITTFKSLYNNDNQTLTNAFIFSSHNSDVIATILSKLEHYSALKSEKQNEICTQLSILEPALINDMNLEHALSKNIHLILLKFIDPKSLAKTEPQSQPVTLLKFLMRCLASTLRNDEFISVFVNIKDSIFKVSSILKYIGDQEILANSAKVIRLVCRDQNNIVVIKNDCKDLPNILVDSIHKYGYSLIVVQELVLALKYYTHVVEAVPNLMMENVQFLVDLYKEANNEKIKSNVQAILIQ